MWTARLRARLLGCPDTVAIERYELPNLRGISFVLRDYLPPSGSAHQLGKSPVELVHAADRMGTS